MALDDPLEDLITEYEQPLELSGTGEIRDGNVHIHVVLGSEGNQTIMPDRIDAGVLSIAAGITGGTIRLVGGDVLDSFGVAKYKLEQMGLSLHAAGAVTTVTRPAELHPINIITDTHPGFATDLQPPLMALATQAGGTSYFRERIHDACYALVGELTKLGAQISVEGEKATVTGKSRLRGGEVVAAGLRTGISLVLAGLVAQGTTVIGNAQMIDRGHADLVVRLTALGADITRHE